MRQLYVCEWNPNGTNDLLVVEDGQIIDCLPEALFGVRVENDPRLEKQTYGCADFVGEFDPEEVSGCSEFCLVREISAESALHRVAVSPMSDGSEVEAFITKAVSGE